MKIVSNTTQNLEKPTLLPSGQRMDGLLSRVESTMLRLARGGRVDRTGSMALSQIESGGKRFRARLALLACDTFLVPEHDAVCLAAAVELLHNATLIHDDIQDGDTSRRGRPTLWAKHGMAQAINAGDYMLMLPFLAVGEIRSEQKTTLSVTLAEYATRIVRGQVEELGLRGAGRFDWESYLSAASGKTGALIALPVLGAALLSGRDQAHAEALAELFVKTGTLFQVQDDVVDLFGEKGRNKVGCDVYEGKISALVVAQFERAPQTKAEVLEILDRSREQTGPRDVERMQELFLRSGALHQVLSLLVETRDAVITAPELALEPALLPVTERLVALALAPVAHLLPNCEPVSQTRLAAEVTA